MTTSASASTSTSTNTFTFTASALSARQAKHRAGQSSAYTDAKVSYLKLETSKKGTATFWFRGQRNGERFAQRIGLYPAVTIDEARSKALELKGRLDLGEDITVERNRLKAEPTLREFFDEQYMPYAKSAKKSWRDDQNRFKRIGEKFGDSKLSHITRRDVQQFHLDMKRHVAVATCNRLLVLLSAIFQRAIEWDVTKSSPCVGLKQFKENNARTRYLDEAEIAAFLAGLEGDSNPVAAAVLKGLLLTGLRKSELKDRKWADINLERGELFLRDSKNGRARTVQLSEDMRALLLAQPSRTTSEWVFPGRDGNAPIANVDKTWRRTLARAGITTPITIHGLRHTAASHLVMRGVSLPIVGQILGQRSLAMTSRYSHLGDRVVQNALGVLDGVVRAAAAKPQAEAATEDGEITTCVATV